MCGGEAVRERLEGSRKWRKWETQRKEESEDEFGGDLGSIYLCVCGISVEDFLEKLPIRV